MSERLTGPYDTIARRWLALVERRQEHFLELCDTGRWRHYYTQAEFLVEMKKVLDVRDQWAAIAGVPLSEEDPAEVFLRNDDPQDEDLQDENLQDDDLPPPAPAVVEMPFTPWPD